jgi:FAD-dependent urate hydroxylase
LDDERLRSDLAELGLAAHERRVARDLALLNLPPANWPEQKPGLVDVLIVGAGMCGIAAAAELIFKGVRNIRVVDRNPEGREGPWVTFARMETLRSPKHLTGPAMGIPSLTFRAWYEAIHGAPGWERLGKIPNAVWVDYLTWLRRVLALPVANDTAVTRLVPAGGSIEAHLETVCGTEVVRARRIVLATGRGGTGGLYLPDFVDRALWPDLAAHTAEPIDFARLTGKRIAVIGGGDSSWDNAATALERGAARVDMYVRRAELPQINVGRGAALPGFFAGVPALEDADRWDLLAYREDHPAPPPRETVFRTLRQPGFNIHLGVAVTETRREAGRAVIRFADGRAPETPDFVIVGTGFEVDLALCPELRDVAPLVATWGDRYAPALERPELARYPYLGPAFEFQEKVPGSAPDVTRIHLVNYAAIGSLGALAGDVPGVPWGAERLSQAIAAAFFREDIAHMRRQLDAFDEPELEGTPFFTLDRRTPR